MPTEMAAGMMASDERPTKKDLKMLFVSDVHVRDRPTSNREDLDRYFADMGQKVKELEPDVIVAGGDYTDYDTPFWEREHAKVAFDRLSALGKPVYLVHGNHDRQEVVEEVAGRYQSVRYLVGGHEKVDGYSLIATGGEGMTDNPHTPGHHPDETITKWLEDGYAQAKASGSAGKDTVVISHAPPKGTGYPRFRDNYEQALKDFVDENEPLLSVSGHTHSYGCEVKAWKNDYELFFDLDRKEVVLKKDNGYRRKIDYEMLENGVKVDGEEMRLVRGEGGSLSITMGTLRIDDDHGQRETHVAYDPKEWGVTSYLNTNALKKGVFGYVRAREFEDGTQQVDLYGNVSSQVEALDAENMDEPVKPTVYEDLPVYSEKEFEAIRHGMPYTAA